MSRNNPEPHLRDMVSNTKTAVYMATLHKGAWMANWAKIPAKVLGFVKSTNKSLLEVLETDNQLLESIHIDFLNMLSSYENQDAALRSLVISKNYHCEGLK